MNFLDYEFTNIENKGCRGHQYNNFTDIKTAEDACISLGKNCSAVYDASCGGEKKFNLCPANSTKPASGSCIRLKILVGKIK